MSLERMSAMQNSDDGRATAKAAVVNTIGNCITMLTAVVMIPVTTRLLSTADMGLTVNFQSIRNICLIIFTLASYLAVQRGMLDFKEDKKAYINSILCFNIAFISVIFLIFAAGSFLLGKSLSFLSVFMFISIYCWMAYNTGYNYLMFHNRYILAFIIAMLIGPLSQFLSIYLIMHLESEKYLGRIIGLDFFYCAVGVASILAVSVSSRLQWKKKYIRHALKISLPLVPHLLAQYVLTSSDVLMITALVGPEQSGVYSMAYTISQLLWLLLTQIMSVWSPWVYRRMDEGKIEEVNHNSRTIMWMAVVLAMGLMMIAPEAVQIFLAPAYKDGMYIIPVLVVGAFFQFMYIFFYDVEYFHKETKYIAFASISAAAVNFILNFIFIPYFGYIAASVTTAVGYFVLLVIHYICMKKLDKRKIYDEKTIGTVCVLVAAYAAIMFALIDFMLLRYVLTVLVMLIIIYKQRRHILQFMKVLRGNG